MSNLSSVWAQVEFLLDSGLSLIPVRDKDETAADGAVYVKKSAYYKWKKYQSEIISKEELWEQMEKRNTTAIAIVCGPISSNLEVIDIDTKWQSDAAINLFTSIKDFDQELFNSLRIHKSPSGGYHILYKIIPPFPEFPGNTKLAGRECTEEELLLNPKSKTVTFIETRATGGYVLAPPSMGYTVQKEVEIPSINWQQRTDLINLCKTFDRVIKIAAPAYKQTLKYEGFYVENPWDDYNKRADPIELLTRNGWKQESTKNAKNIYFTRPGKNAGISMSFREDLRKFYCFTVSTEFDVDTAYSPVDVLLRLEFNNDKKKLYWHLVNTGYGKVKSHVEQNLAVSLARKNKSVPANFSPEAVQLNIATVAQLKQDHPYGVFLKYNEDENLIVSREAFLNVANNLGFRFNNGETVRIVGNFIFDISEREFQDILKDYIHEEDATKYENSCNVFESFMQKNGAYSMTRLQELDHTLILKDNKNTCYKFYQNGYLIITADDIDFENYSDNDLLIWEHSVQKRNYIPGNSGDYIDFITKSTIHSDNVKKILGYLAHEYKDETTGYIIVLTESCPDPKNGGGSGKNLFCNLLKLTTSYTSKPGAQTKFDEKFFQSWNRQRIFAISDVPKNFDFLFLKEPATGVFIWKKLFKDEVEIPVEDGPKFIVQTNYSYEILDGGLKRRIIPIEFGNFFTEQGGVDVYYKKYFPDEWNENDYAGFDNYIAEAVQLWLKSGRKLTANELTDTGKTKQWEQTYGVVTTDFINYYLEEWVEMKEVANSIFKQQYDSYMAENNVPKIYQPSTTKINAALEALAKNSDLLFKKDQVITDSINNKFKGRIFDKLPF